MNSYRRQDSQSPSFLISLGLHALLAMLVISEGLLFEQERKFIPPTLRVDIVGLPDQLKNEMPLNAPKGSDETKAVPEKKDFEAPVEQKKEAVSKSNQAADEDSVLVKSKNSSKAREQKLKSALARIKALNKIQDDAPPKERSALIKGNRVSPGSALSGEARETLEASYYDQLRNHVLDHWSLPIWLSRQNLSSQVQVKIDGRGTLRSLVVTKSSSNSQFDDAVKRALIESQPLPAPPSELQAGILTHGIILGFPL